MVTIFIRVFNGILHVLILLIYPEKLRPLLLLKEAGTLKFVGAKLSKWGPDTLKSSEWPFMGLRGSLHIPTRYSGPQGSKLLGKSIHEMG